MKVRYMSHARRRGLLDEAASDLAVLEQSLRNLLPDGSPNQKQLCDIARRAMLNVRVAGEFLIAEKGVPAMPEVAHG